MLSILYNRPGRQYRKQPLSYVIWSGSQCVCISDIFTSVLRNIWIVIDIEPGFIGLTKMLSKRQF